jgi:hypothetical protein
LTPVETETPTPTPTSTVAGCASDGDCDDGNLCTEDACNLGAGVCVHTDAPLPIAYAALGVRSLNTAGKAVLSLRADVPLAIPIAPAIDPAVDGLHVQLVDKLGAVRDAIDLPGGMRDHGQPVGWSTNRNGLSWRFRDSTANARVGGARVVVNKATGRVRVQLTASRGTLPLTSGDAPFVVRVRLGAGTARCGAVTFDVGAITPTCTFSRNGSSIRCR